MKLEIESKSVVKVQGDLGDLTVDQREEGKVYRVHFKGTCKVNTYGEIVEVVFNNE